MQQEVKKLLHQMDDLHADNAMLRAQLLRYRGDLTAALALKDRPLKTLLRTQQDAIRRLEARLAQSGGEEEAQAALRAQLALMRSERETGERRLAELAAELLEAEQRLSRAQTHGGQLTAQQDALCGAMAALQDDRDQLILDFKVLRGRYDQELGDARRAFQKTELRLHHALADLAAVSTHRDLLHRRLATATAGHAPSELQRLLEELGGALAQREAELKRSQLERDAIGRELEAFRGSMSSLQDDRDRLLERLTPRRGAGPQGAKVSRTEEQRGVGGGEEEVGRTDQVRIDFLPVTQEVSGGAEEEVQRLQAEKEELQRELQRCRTLLHNHNQNQNQNPGMT